MKLPRLHCLTLLALLTLGLLIPQAPLWAADVSITSTSVAPSSSAKMRVYKAGAAITAGKLVYLEASTQTVKLADADSATAEARTAIGIATATAATGGLVPVCYKDSAFVIGGTVSNGAVYILSATAGGLAPVADLTTGWYAQVAGLGASTTTISFNFEGGYFRTSTAQ
jgi:hypothetical protein